MNLPENDPGLTLSPSAKSHIQGALSTSKQGSAVGIRVGVKKAGCSGWEYVLEYAYPDAIGEMDYVFDFDTVKVVVDKEIYLKFLKGGTVLEYGADEGSLNEGLKFNNPNVANQCGCGESFTLK